MLPPKAPKLPPLLAGEVPWNKTLPEGNHGFAGTPDCVETTEYNL